MAVLSSAAGELFFQAFEPKVANRFVLVMDGIPSYLVKRTSKPQHTQSGIQLYWIISTLKRKLKGKADWSDMSLYTCMILSHHQELNQ
jgi:hypothetical protein